MKIAHRDLEACNKNPAQWFAAAIAATAHGYKMGYERVLRLCVVYFHKTSAKEARAHMSAMVKKHHFKSAEKVRQIEDSLESYITWVAREKPKVAGTEVKITLTGGFLELGGLVGRVDVTDTGYRAVLFGDAPPDWQTQLRLPLIQTAVATMYGRPVEKTEVGFQRLDGKNLKTTTFSPAQIAAAKQRLEALGKIIGRLAAAKNKPRS